MGPLIVDALCDECRRSSARPSTSRNASPSPPPADSSPPTARPVPKTVEVPFGKFFLTRVGVVGLHKATTGELFEIEGFICTAAFMPIAEGWTLVFGPKDDMWKRVEAFIQTYRYFLLTIPSREVNRGLMTAQQMDVDYVEKVTTIDFAYLRGLLF